jgi:omega-amidase
MPTLRIAAVQKALVWQDTAANHQVFESEIAQIHTQAEVIILPEMFTTGFTMQVENCAENMQGPTMMWMKNMAAEYKVILTGSLIVEEQGKYYNRLIWMQPDGQFYSYDKRHLFSYANEHTYFTAGNKRLHVQVNGLRIALHICYDLRFPVWSRQTKEQPYDAAIYVANWPSVREAAWTSLLQARAIENQCYVVGVNRIGKDGNDIEYSGASAMYNFAGELIQTAGPSEGTIFAQLDSEEIKQHRARFAFLSDADDYTLLP